MSRYIEQDFIGSAVSNLPTTILQTEHSIELVVPVTDVIETIKNAPSIDIVRCSECKHSEFCEKKIHRHGIAYSIDFCSYGSRSERSSE